MRINGLRISMLAASLGLYGCGGSDKPQPVAPREFFSGAPNHPSDDSPITQQVLPGQPPVHEAPLVSPPAEPIEGISEDVRSVVKPPEVDLATSQPSFATTSPSTNPIIDPGIFIFMGGLAAEVNGKPIYCNDVIRLDYDYLRDGAREKSRAQFEIYARERIQRALDTLIYDELEVAAAQRTLDSQDRQFAVALTERWRQDQITKAGGSLQLAYRRAEDQGKKFDDLVENQHRYFEVILYYQRKVYPRIQITRSDLYRYYTAHLNDPELKFTKHATADVQIIVKIPAHEDPDDPVHGKEMALSEIKDLRDQALKGVDFEGLMSRTDSNMVPKNFEQGSSKLVNVEQAALSLQSGQISDIIEDGGRFYLVKVLKREGGSVQPFSDPKVQDTVESILKREQLRQLKDEEQLRLRKEAIVQDSPEMEEACVELAMQNYAKWAKEK